MNYALMMMFIFSFSFYIMAGTLNLAPGGLKSSSVLLMVLMWGFFCGNAMDLEVCSYGYSLGMDSLSFSLVVLSFWVSLLMIVSSYKIILFDDSSKNFCMLIMFLFLVLLVTFTGTNYLMFYFMFEISLIPTLLIIMGWGYQPERLQAGIYFLFYTLSISLPLLISLLWMYYKVGFLHMYLADQLNLSNLLSVFISVTLSGAFLVKLPMFLTHLWLPKAHVEAPVAGSMILAGVLLKLGGYGLFRLLVLCGLGMKFIGGFLLGLSMMGMLFVGLICCRLNDFKALVAYSSVAHMALVISGVYSYYIWGYNGSLMMMVSHGLSSSGLFCVVNMYYERLGSRSFFINSGLMLLMPIYSGVLFMLCAANISAPPSINLLSEIFLMASIMNYDLVMMLIFPLGSFLGAVFTLFMFSYSQHGSIYNSVLSYMMINARELHVLLLHVIPLNFLVLKTDYFLVVV
uniref:NADH-ubiquinone oxidoreductase chain 4 n=1 Tax=Metisotoma macnamarai TaxID=2682814 RepID=A0A650DPZ7_9HEXA|nr:NADH dehydrogenase subunit 4 [Metisotoma macnamarai]